MDSNNFAATDATEVYNDPVYQKYKGILQGAETVRKGSKPSVLIYFIGKSSD